jgi:hypothetical protein
LYKLDRYYLQFFAALAIVFIVILFSLCLQVAFSQSPSFTRQELVDTEVDYFNITHNTDDWLDIKDWNKTWSPNDSSVTNIIDLRRIASASNGKNLSATYWVLPNFKSINNSIFDILIETDSNKATGQHGIDYRVHDIWNNTNKSWTKNIEEIGFPLMNLSDRLTLNEDSFSITNRSEYVKLSLDLEALGFPDHYSVIFYVGNSSQNKMDHKFTNRAQHTIVDFLDRIFVLLPQYSLITNPSTIELRQGDDRKFKCS